MVQNADGNWSGRSFLPDYRVSSSGEKRQNARREKPHGHDMVEFSESVEEAQQEAGRIPGDNRTSRRRSPA